MHEWLYGFWWLNAYYLTWPSRSNSYYCEPPTSGVSFHIALYHQRRWLLSYTTASHSQFLKTDTLGYWEKKWIWGESMLHIAKPLEHQRNISWDYVMNGSDTPYLHGFQRNAIHWCNTMAVQVNSMNGWHSTSICPLIFPVNCMQAKPRKILQKGNESNKQSGCTYRTFSFALLTSLVLYIWHRQTSWHPLMERWGIKTMTMRPDCRTAEEYYPY